jgi:hypothetical protein
MNAIVNILKSIVLFLVVGVWFTLPLLGSILCVWIAYSYFGNLAAFICVTICCFIMTKLNIRGDVEFIVK